MHIHWQISNIACFSSCFSLLVFLLPLWSATEPSSTSSLSFMSAVVKWCVLPIPCRCHSGSLCLGGELNTAAFPTSCLPRWHMEGLSRNALFALWHSTEFVEEQWCTRTGTAVELEPNRKSQTSQTFTILCFDTGRGNEETPLSAVCVKAAFISQQMMANITICTYWNDSLSPNPPRTKVCNVCKMTGKTHRETVGRPSTYEAFVWEYFGYREESRHEFESNREFGMLLQIPLLTGPKCSLQKAPGALHCGALCFYSVY